MARELLRRAERGEMDSLMYIGAGLDHTEIGIYGHFAEDLDFATEAASEGFSRLVGKKLTERDPLPLSFRKA